MNKKTAPAHPGEQAPENSSSCTESRNTREAESTPLRHRQQTPEDADGFPEIEIIYQDEHLIVVNKPPLIHVHATRLSRGETSLQNILENQLETTLFPIHRLDRPACGLLVMAKTQKAASVMGSEMRNRENFSKKYIALVRGYMEGQGVIERPLRQAPGKPEREAVTHWRSLATAEAPWSDGVFPSSRYSLVECTLESGRFHQIRRHLSIASHPIIGDVSHGDNKRNRIWLANTGIKGLFLQACKLAFTHPVSRKYLSFTAPPDTKFIKAAEILGWEADGCEADGWKADGLEATDRMADG